PSLRQADRISGTLCAPRHSRLPSPAHEAIEQALIGLSWLDRRAARASLQQPFARSQVQSRLLVLAVTHDAARLQDGHGLPSDPLLIFLSGGLLSGARRVSCQNRQAGEAPDKFYPPISSPSCNVRSANANSH